ncbi:hypothetical protein J4Q44_G00303010 [Coregonus suidteri]|uniref:G-protein coupled receptors family 1 profile domain-containing protein n=1 Tax=Coregonus suidteri TaxID=861788 RepID=A0AAN8QHP4_9TELE
MLSMVILGVFLSLLILLTVCGNVLVCLAVCATRRLRCLTNCFIVSLAITDLLLGMLVLPFSALLQLSNWPLGPTICNIYISLDVMLCTASILTLLAISLDRYLAVTAPLRYSSLVLPRRVALAMALVWAVSLAVSFLPIHLGWNTVDGSVQNRDQGDNKTECNFELNPSYAVVDASLTFYLPLLIMCWTYHRILRIARAQARRIIHARPSLNNNNSPSSAPRHLTSVTAVALREHKATVTLAAVIGVFVVCWLPYFTLFTIMGLKEQNYPAAYPVIRQGEGPAIIPNAFMTGGGKVCGGEVALLCGHTSSCRAGPGETGMMMMLQEVSSGTATPSPQHSNRATVANGNDRSC